ALAGVEHRPAGQAGADAGGRVADGVPAVDVEGAPGWICEVERGPASLGHRHGRVERVLDDVPDLEVVAVRLTRPGVAGVEVERPSLVGALLHPVGPYELPEVGCVQARTEDRRGHVKDRPERHAGPRAVRNRRLPCIAREIEAEVVERPAVAGDQMVPEARARLPGNVPARVSRV